MLSALREFSPSISDKKLTPAAGSVWLGETGSVFILTEIEEDEDGDYDIRYRYYPAKSLRKRGITPSSDNSGSYCDHSQDGTPEFRFNPCTYEEFDTMMIGDSEAQLREAGFGYLLDEVMQGE